MRERKPQGMLMSGPMVLALLREARSHGTGKRETRRMVNPQPGDDLDNTGDCESVIDMATGRTIAPRYRVGDQVWIKETHAYVGTCDPGLLIWRADYPACVPAHYETVPQDPASVRWTPSLLMPRRASRIGLRIREIALERVQAITEADAIAEGIERVWVLVGANCNGGIHQEEYAWRYYIPGWDVDGPDDCFDCPIAAYEALWRSLHTRPGERWDDNPWVWVYRFEDITEEDRRGK